MKQVVVCCVIALMLGVVQAGAQVSDETILTYEVLTEDYDALVREAMGLSDEQWAEFEPVLDDYKAAMDPVFERRVNIIKEFVKKGGELTEDEAATLLDRIADVERDEWLVLRDFEREFLEVLPATRVLRFLQIETRMNLMLMSSVAKDIPLAK